MKRYITYGHQGSYNGLHGNVHIGSAFGGGEIVVDNIEAKNKREARYLARKMFDAIEVHYVITEVVEQEEE